MSMYVRQFHDPHSVTLSYVHPTTVVVHQQFIRLMTTAGGHGSPYLALIVLFPTMAPLIRRLAMRLPDAKLRKWLQVGTSVTRGTTIILHVQHHVFQPLASTRLSGLEAHAMTGKRSSQRRKANAHDNVSPMYWG